MEQDAIVDSEFISEGESKNFTTSQKDIVFNITLKCFTTIGQLENFSEPLYTKRTQLINNMLCTTFGGDWICISGQRMYLLLIPLISLIEGTPFSYYIPSIRHLCFLVYKKHFVFVAQIFEPRKPITNLGSS